MEKKEFRNQDESPKNSLSAFVGFMSIINDTDMELELVIDQKFKKVNAVVFKPFLETCSIAISQNAMENIIDVSKHKPNYVDFSVL